MAITVSAKHLRASTWSGASVNDLDTISLGTQTNGGSESAESSTYDNRFTVFHEDYPNS
jgi:hypothetical protein